MTATCIVVGASHAAAQMSVSIRQNGWNGKIIVIGNESYMPYQRPPLSKGFLAGDKQLSEIPLKPEKAYNDADIEFKLNTHVIDINRAEKTVTLLTGETLSYTKLALCTGAEVNKIPLSAGNLGGVHYLRSADDATKIRDEIAPNKHAVIVGGGFIGLEIAAVLAQKDMRVTVLEAQESILQRVVSPEVSQYFTALHESYGVTIKTADMARALTGSDVVTGVECASGELIPADMVIIGVGVTPRTGLAEKAGLTVEQGIRVDQFALTSDPDIVAAGDCTCYFHELYQRDVRVESIQNALEQAKSAAASINDKQVPFSGSVPRFWSDQYDVKLQICGLIDGYDHVEITQDLAARKLKALYLKGGKPIAAIAINHPKFLMGVQAVIKLQESITDVRVKEIFSLA